MGNSTKRILCVEDDKDFCELLTLTLPEFEFINAATVSDAVKKAREGNYSMIFLEQLLPDGTGQEACRRIRSFDITTPIIFMSESRFMHEGIARSLGAQVLLKKSSPTFFDDLQSHAALLSAA